MSEPLNWSDWFYYDETSPSCLRWEVARNWRSEIGKRKVRMFSHNKYGEAEAFNLAKMARIAAIARLNILGYEYTERHGND